MNSLLLWLHLLAAAFWVGGMATMQLAVRPSAVAVLTAPPQRLAFMAAVLQRFFAGVAVSVVVVLASGLALVMLKGGFAAQPPGVHAMFAGALVMAAVFAWIRLRLYPRVQQALAAGQLPQAAAALDPIRKLVNLNLVIGVAVFAAASL